MTQGNMSFFGSDSVRGLESVAASGRPPAAWCGSQAATICTSAGPQPNRAGGGPAGETFGALKVWLRERVPPPIITVIPWGDHWLWRPSQQRGWSVSCKSGEVAAVLNEELQGLRRRAAAGQGEPPRIDREHLGGAVVGEPLECWWGGGLGVLMSVRWTPAGEADILEGRYRFFSPTFVVEKGRILGLRSGNVGGLTNRPAFKRMVEIRPVPRELALTQLAQRYLHLLLDSDLDEAEIDARFPDYLGAYRVLEDFRQRQAAQAAVRARALQAERLARERQVATERAAELLRIVDRRYRAAGNDRSQLGAIIAAARDEFPLLRDAYDAVYVGGGSSGAG